MQKTKISHEYAERVQNYSCVAVSSARQSVHIFIPYENSNTLNNVKMMTLLCHNKCKSDRR